MPLVRDVPSNMPIKQSEIEQELNVLEGNIKRVQSKITTLSERIASILRNDTETAGDEPKRDVPKTSMARRLVESSATLASVIKEIDFLIDGCELSRRNNGY